MLHNVVNTSTHVVLQMPALQQLQDNLAATVCAYVQMCVCVGTVGCMQEKAKAIAAC